MGWQDSFIEAVNALTPDLDALYENSHTYHIDDWNVLQRSLVTASGAGSVAIPGIHLAGVAADLAFVINRIGVASYGVGSILGADKGVGNIIEKEDLAGILIYWVDDEDFMQAMKGKGSASLSTKIGTKIVYKVGGKIAVKGLTKTMLTSAGYLVAQKFAGKAAGKAAAKFTSKFGAKAVGGFVPFLGPIVGGGVNLWLLDGIMKASVKFYNDKINIVERMV